MFRYVGAGAINHAGRVRSVCMPELRGHGRRTRAALVIGPATTADHRGDLTGTGASKVHAPVCDVEQASLSHVRSVGRALRGNHSDISSYRTDSPTNDDGRDRTDDCRRDISP
jgi:hypothetical protein